MKMIIVVIIPPFSNHHITELCKGLEGATVPKELATKVETVFSSLIQELQQLQNQNECLQTLYEK